MVGFGDSQQGGKSLDGGFRGNFDDLPFAGWQASGRLVDQLKKIRIRPAAPSLDAGDAVSECFKAISKPIHLRERTVGKLFASANPAEVDDLTGNEIAFLAQEKIHRVNDIVDSAHAGDCLSGE